ncbi:MAG: type II toxin-antitoxin system HicA family toxin [Bacteroidales bacterium]|nr:type II toxin-antitoxin system HicA family toxin [Bacteroidales bacterium]
MKYSEFYKLLESHGWVISKGKRHYKYVKPGVNHFIPVGRHQSQEIPKGTLERMLKDAGLK